MRVFYVARPGTWGKLIEASTLQSNRDSDERVDRVEHMEKGSVGKSTGKHVAFVKSIEIETFLHFWANGRGLKEFC